MADLAGTTSYHKDITTVANSALQICTGTISLAGDYVTGGFSLDLRSKFGLLKDVIFEHDSAYIFNYDHTNRKVLMYNPLGSVAATGAGTAHSHAITTPTAAGSSHSHTAGAITVAGSLGSESTHTHASTGLTASGAATAAGSSHTHTATLSYADASAKNATVIDDDTPAGNIIYVKSNAFSPYLCCNMATDTANKTVDFDGVNVTIVHDASAAVGGVALTFDDDGTQPDRLIANLTTGDCYVPAGTFPYYLKVKDAAAGGVDLYYDDVDGTDVGLTCTCANNANADIDLVLLTVTNAGEAAHSHAAGAITMGGSTAAGASHTHALTSVTASGAATAGEAAHTHAITTPTATENAHTHAVTASAGSEVANGTTITGITDLHFTAIGYLA